MVSSYTTSTFTYLVTHRFAQTSGHVGALFLLALVVLLAGKEVLAAAVPSLPASTKRIFDVAALPLLLAFAILVVERFRGLGF